MIKEDPLEKYLKISFSIKKRNKARKRKKVCPLGRYAPDLLILQFQSGTRHNQDCSAECVSSTGREKHLAFGDTSEWRTAVICGAQPKRRTDSTR